MLEDACSQRIERTTRVGAAEAGRRLDQVAARLFPEFSRARLQAWIREGALRLDGAMAKPRSKVREGSELRLAAHLQPEVTWRAQDLPLSVLFEDADLLVLNKPAGLVVHPGAGNPHGTLVNALLRHRPALERIPRAGIVHRLDKDTSGLLVVAASLRAHAGLVAQLQRRALAREYFAIVRGVPTSGGTVDAPIGRHPRQRTRMAVLSHGGKAARTHFRLGERFAHYTALNVELETGRTHQIRVHLAHRGFPLLGDPVYAARLQFPRGCSEPLAESLRGFRRQALHARRLRFCHPRSGAVCEYEAPLAEDLQALLEVLRREDPAAPCAPG